MKNRSFYAVACLIALSACGGDVKETLGLNREAPDEFAVQSRPALDVPPAFKLRPPAKGGENLRESSIRDELRAEILPNSIASTKLGSAESFLLQKADAQDSSADIRKVLNEEYGVEDPTLLERIRSISDDSGSTNTLIDADKERERILGNKKAGKAITDGEVETRDGNASFSVLESIIGE